MFDQKSPPQPALLALFDPNRTRHLAAMGMRGTSSLIGLVELSTAALEAAADRTGATS